MDELNDDLVLLEESEEKNPSSVEPPDSPVLAK